MFKEDKKTLDYLSFRLNEQDVSRLKTLFDCFKKDNVTVLSNSEIDSGLSTLEKISELKLNGKHYAFHIEDDWANNQTGAGSGVMLYKRQGERLEPLTSLFEYAPRLDDIYKIINLNKIDTLYTGEFPYEGFFNLKETTVDNDGDGIILSSLNEYEEYFFTKSGIKVIRLDTLI